MSEDLIAGNFVENINKSLVKRNIRLVSVVFILVGIYAIVDFIDWYNFLSRSALNNTTGIVFFFHWLRPVVLVILITISIINWMLAIRANKLIDKSLEFKDADFFNQAYILFCRISVLTIISYSIATISLASRIIFKY